MTTDQLRRLNGRALVLAGLLCVAGGVLHPVEHGHAHSAEALLSPHEWLGSGLLLAGTTLLLLALPFVYVPLAEGMGRLGLAGFVLYFVGNVLSSVPHLVVMALIGPEVAHHAPALISPDDMIIASDPWATEQVVTGMALVSGLLLFGVGLLRSRLVPRWIGAVAVAGTVLLLVPLPALPVVSGLQIEVPRAVVVIALGILAARATSPRARLAAPETVAA